MSSLPSGTVTFLFTDIEGSTKLARAHPETWEAARARHHTILREAIESNNGYIFQIIGDAFCATFHKSTSALKVATQAQQELKSETWDDVVIRVRMGIHTGEGELQEDGQYQGYLALSLVQRIMSAGHGGQVLLSGATENLLRGSLPDSVDLLDMGRHNFKDVPQAVRVFQVGAPDLQRDFPPLRTFDILPNNLPAQLTSFVGREKELADVKRLLADTHMLTLIGPGGTGKTRLSIQAANDVLSQYPDGVWLVDLAPILDPLLVPRTTAITIGLRNEPQRPVIDMICDYLSKKKMLIILDNCEHLVDACAQMSDRILQAASEVQILASSREALGIAGEVTYRVPSLGLPDVDNLPSLENLSQYEAVKLFIDRAAAAIPDFKVTNENAPALAQICHRLDGIPLALELAAAKIRVLGVEQIAKRLDDRFKLLTGGSRTAMERHQTLRATVDWSYNLLPPEEQTLFRRLAVFRGGWTLEAAESICGDDVLDLLEQLINKSLVITDDEQGVSRFRMLETIRQYANEKLVDSGESEALREKHLEFFLNLAETAEPHLYRHEQLEWLAQLDADYENLRAALGLAIDKESAEPSLRLCAALGMYWIIRGYWKEGSKWLARALNKPPQNQNPDELTARVRALNQDAKLAQEMDDLERTRNSAELSLKLAQDSTNTLDIAIARFLVGFALYRHNSYDEARPLMERTLSEFQKLNNNYWEAYTFRALGFLSDDQSNFDFGEWRLQAVNLARKAGERLLLADALWDYSNIFYWSHQLTEGMKFIREADKSYKQIRSKSNKALYAFSVNAWLEDDYEKARLIMHELLEQLDLIGEKNLRSTVAVSLGRLAQEQGNLEQAQIYFEEALATSREISNQYEIPYRLASLSNVFYQMKNLNQYKEYLNEGILKVKPLNSVTKMYFLLNVLITLSSPQPETAALILGAIHANERNNKKPLVPLEKYYYVKAENQTREKLGAEAFESVFAEGQKVSLDEALDLVLNSVEEMDE